MASSVEGCARGVPGEAGQGMQCPRDRKSTRLNSSHEAISYAVFCLKKKKQDKNETLPQDTKVLIANIQTRMIVAENAIAVEQDESAERHVAALDGGEQLEMKERGRR